MGSPQAGAVLATFCGAWVAISPGLAIPLVVPLVPTALTPNEDEIGTEFATSLEVDGDLLVIGAPWANEGNRTDAGAVFVFRKGPDGWQQEARLTAPDAAFADHFGSSVALDGPRLLAGAPDADQPGRASVGAAYVFSHADAGWSFEAKLVAPDGEAFEFFGQAVALEGDRAAAGRFGRDEGGVTNVGAVDLFARTPAGWSHTATIEPPAGVSSLGRSLALAGDTLVAGAPHDATVAGTGAGTVHAFSREGGAWTHVAQLEAPQGVAFGRFGWSIALDGDALAVGTLRAAVGAAPHPGHAYLFERVNGAWAFRAQFAGDDPSEQDLFGVSVALDGDLLVVGASADDWVRGPGGLVAFPDGGAAYAFTRVDAGWGSNGTKLLAPDRDVLGSDGDHGGAAVGVGADEVFVGAPKAENPDDRATGAVYVFRRVDI